MVEEWRAGFNTVSHLCSITEAGEEVVGQVAFGPDVLGGVEWMPTTLYEWFDIVRNIVGDREGWVKLAVGRIDPG